MLGKEFTSFDAAAVVRELKTEVLDSLVSNIYQLDLKTLQLKLHKTGRPTIWLILEAGRRINLTAYATEKPSTPSAFCMALRKYLRNARIVSIEQYEFERVVTLSFKTEEGNLKLILELFGDGNLILVGVNGEILQALTYRRMRDRNVVRGEPFKFAPSRGKNPLRVKNEELWTGIRSFDRVEVVRALARFLSIGGIYAEEILIRAGVEKTRVSGSLDNSEMDAIYERLQEMLSRVINGDLEPNVVVDESAGSVDAVPLMLRRYEGQTLRIERYGTFNEALDEFFSKLSALKEVAEDAEAGNLKAEEARLGRIIADQQSVLPCASAEAERYRHVGDLIYAHFSELQTVFEKFLAERKDYDGLKSTISYGLRQKQTGIRPWVFFESFDSKKSIIEFRIDDAHFSVELQRTLFENAARFYQLSKRARQKLEGAQAALNDSQRKLNEVQAKIRDVEQNRLAKPGEAMERLEKRKIRHKEWFEKFRWFVSSDGFLVVAGKDAVTNEVLIKKHTDSHDVVFHADILGAPFVVVKTEGKNPSEQCLREAGEFAAAFSRGWRERFASVDVYWVRPDQLGKGGPSGESVGRGAFAVRGQRNWMRGVPLRMAVGVAFDEETRIARIGGGPVDSVRARANVYVVVVPGDLSGKEFFKRLIRRLGEKTSKDLREAVLGTSVEDIREFVPFGRGTLLEC